MTLHRQHTNQEAPAARHLQKVGISGSRTSYPPPTPPPLLPPSSSLPVDQRSPERSPLKPLPRSGTNSSRRSADSGYASDCYSDPGHRPRSWASPTRKLNADEENAACAFIEHADECWDCNCLGSDRRLREQLCGIGASLAGELGRLIYISQDGGIWSRTDNRQVRLGYKLGLRFESVCGWAEALERSLCRGDTSLLPRDNDPWNHSRGHDPRRANSIQKTPPPLERARLGKGGTESARTLTKALETIASYQKAPDLRRRTIFEDIRKQFTDSATKRALPHQLPAAPDKTVNLGSLLVKDQSSVADSPHEPCAFFVPRWTPGESTQSRETGEATVHFDSAGRAVENALTQFEKLTFQEGGNHAASEPTDGIEGSSPSQKRHQQSSSPPSSRAYLQRLQRKRVRGDRDPGDDSGDDDGNNDRPPKRDGKRPDSAPNRRLKCPFYQRAPEKCPNKACRGEGFTDIAKLKDHIKRVHTQPLRCVRCWQQMDSEDAYDAHRQEDISCKKRPEPADDRLRPQVLKSKLDFKKAPYTNAKSTEEKWRMVFGRLFPGEEVPSPYDQHGFTSRQERILSEVLEDELTRELGPASGIRIHRIKTQTLQAFRRRLMSISLENEDTVTRKSKSMEIPEDNTTVTPETENDYTPTSSQATMSSADMNNASHTIAGFVESLPKTRPANPQRCHPSPSACSTEGIQESLYESSPTNIFCSSTSLPSSYATDLTRSEVYGSTEDIQTCNYPPSLRRFFPQRRPQIPLSRTQSSHLWSPSDPKGNPTQYSDGALSFSNDMHTILEEPFQMMESTSLFEENGEEEWAWDAYPVSMEESGSRLEYSPAKDQRNGYQ